jgi:hypothetical protein
MKPIRVVLYCLLGGLALAPIAMGNHAPGATWLAGIVLAAAFVPIAIFGPPRALQQFAVIAPIFLVVTDLCLWSEVLVFFPTPEVRQRALADLVAPAVIYLIVAIALAALASLLKLPRAVSARVEMRPPIKVACLVLACGIAYLLYYLVFGAITYRFFTHDYYPDGPQIVAKLGIWFWLIQLARGVLMTLAVLPAIYTLRMTRLQSAFAIAILLWVAGGLFPLLLPNLILGPFQRLIHTVEILTQNASLGITAVLLLRARNPLQDNNTGN